MRNLDDMIDEVLEGEERELLRRIGEEPGYFSQIGDLFSGKTGWVSAVLILVQTLVFIVGAWMAWRFFQADNVLEAMRWGLPSAVLLVMSLVMKMSFWPQMHINRVLRELKLIELQIARQGKD